MTDQAQQTGQPTVWGEIEGTTITFPMEVTRFDAATFGFTVPADAAARLLPGDAFEVIEADGTAQFVLALCDYHENPWGDYLELNLGFLVRAVDAPEGETGSFVYRMPVDQAFTCRAGNEVMGFPKTVEDLSVTHADGQVTFAMHTEGELVLSVSFPDAPATGTPERVDTDSYSYLVGRAYATRLSMDLGTGFLDPTDVTVELGTGPIAEELRTLGLPTAPDFGAWGRDLSATFDLGRPIV